MKRLLLSIFGIVMASSVASAQNTTATDNDALQASLEAKAQRIPASDLAAALSAGDNGRSDRARMVRVRPDWAEVRADLQRTTAEDAERDTSNENETRTLPTRQLRGAPPPPPPPGLRALRSKSVTAGHPERSRHRYHTRHGTRTSGYQRQDQNLRAGKHVYGCRRY